MNQQIYQKILNRILFFEYVPGQILNENALAKEFGLSRTPLRDVLSRLEWEQLVKIIPRTGTIVSEIEFQKIMHVFQIRLEIEDFAGRLAAQMATEAHLEEIEKINKACIKLQGQRSQKSLVEMDFRFREVLYEAANNPVLRDMSRYLYHLTIRLSYILFERGDWSEGVKASLQEYEQVHGALSRKNSQEAGKIRRKWLRTHIERIKDKF